MGRGKDDMKLPKLELQLQNRQLDQQANAVRVPTTTGNLIYDDDEVYIALSEPAFPSSSDFAGFSASLSSSVSCETGTSRPALRS
jgi:hypothetical protein